MARPYDESPKVWKFIRANDAAFLILFAFVDFILSFFLITHIGLGPGLAVGLMFLTLIAAFYFIKAQMPTNFFWNFLSYRASPRLFTPGPEPSEIQPEREKKK